MNMFKEPLSQRIRVGKEWKVKLERKVEPDCAGRAQTGRLEA